MKCVRIKYGWFLNQNKEITKIEQCIKLIFIERGISNEASLKLLITIYSSKFQWLKAVDAILLMKHSQRCVKMWIRLEINLKFNTNHQQLFQIEILVSFAMFATRNKLFERCNDKKLVERHYLEMTATWI